MSRSRLSFAVMRMTYFTPILVNLWLGTGSIGAKRHHFTEFLLLLDLRSSSSAQASALCTLPGSSFTARQSPSPLNNNG